MKNVTGRMRYDMRLKDWVPVAPPPRYTGRLGIKVDRSGQYQSVGLGRNSPWATRHHPVTKRAIFSTRQEKRDAILRAADHGEQLFMADEVYGAECDE